MKIRDLRPGDRLDGSPTGESATLISWSVPHPVYPGLALVVWRMGDGRLSLDALDPEQHDVTGSRVVAQSEDERLESLRRALDPPPAAVAAPPPAIGTEEAAPRPVVSRYFIAVTPGTGLRLGLQVNGQHPPNPPKGPFPISALRDLAAFEAFPETLLPRSDEALMWEVDEAVYREWNGDDDEDSCDDDDD